MKEYTSAVIEADAEDKDRVKEASQIKVKIDGRLITANRPTPGQLTLMLAASGRGQTAVQRFSSILNVFLATFEDESKDYIESRLNSTVNPLDMEVLERVFEDMLEEWFATPTE